MMTRILSKLETFKEYCKITNQLEKYGYVHEDDEGKLYVITFSGKKIKHIAYQHKEIPYYSGFIGKIAQLGEATCGYGTTDGTGKCEIGKPNPICVKDGIYSKNKCAIIFLEYFDLKHVRYSVSHEEFLLLAKACNLT